jgi:subtilisin family serine protease
MARILAVFVILLCQFSFADEFLVRVKNYPNAMNDFATKVTAQGMNVVTVYELVPGLMRIEASAEAFGVLNSLPEVQYVEFNHYRRPSVLRSSQTLGENGPIVRPPIPAATPRPIEWKKNGGDTRNYGLYQNRTIDIFNKRQFYGSEKTIIAVLDTGVDYTHRDLAANMWRNPGESGDGKESNGIDDDGNGYIDDVIGWDTFHDDNLAYDDYGHGSHVAGIAAAVGGDGWGIAGQCPRCSIMAVKFITAEGWGSDGDAIEGLEYAAKMGANVINSSWGGEEFGQALFDAFEATSKMGIINTVAAGNNGIDLSFGIPNIYPAEFVIPGLYTIAALYEVNIFIPFWSNYSGSVAHFSMGGADVYSTIPGGKHAAMSGTSMASPNAAGVLALMKSYRPALSFDQITGILKRKAIIADKDSLSKTIFGGRADMVKVFELLDKLPVE